MQQSITDIEAELYENLGYCKAYSEMAKRRKERLKARKAAELKRRHEHIYFAAQKIIGALLIFATLAAVPAMDYDATAAVIMLPLGAHLIFTKKHALQIMGEYCEH